MSKKVSPEIESDGLPTYEYAIQMQADYIKSPRDDQFTGNKIENRDNANYSCSEDESPKNCNFRQKLLITIFIVCIFGFIFLTILIC